MNLTKRNLMLTVAAVMGLSVSAFAEPENAKEEMQMQEPCPIMQQCNNRPEVNCKSEMFGKKKGMFDKKCHDFKKNMDKAGITQEQKDKIKDLMAKDKAKCDVKDESKEIYAKIDEELGKAKYDKKKINNYKKALKDIKGKKIDAKIDKKIAIREIITPEQYVIIFKERTPFDDMADRLNLNEDQKKTIQAIFENTKKNREELAKQKVAKQKALNEELEKENCDKAVVENLTKEISDISSQMIKSCVETRVQLKTVLTPEQYKKLCSKPDIKHNAKHDMKHEMHKK